TKDYPLLLTLIFEFAQKYKLPLFIHTGLSEADEPLQFEKWFCKFPDVKTHLAHCKDPDATISLFSKHPNLLGDTAFCPHDSYSKICKAGFKDRMLFGTDFPITHWYEQNKNADYDFNSLNKNYQRLQLSALNTET
ncbi:MAG: amidohydrolase family protein, partial [Treponema sp.]|nr:amidohydrolase family protein [Treponema sp.]